MPQRLAQVALLVRDYDEAIAWFTEKLGFTAIADDYQAEQNKRWVLVAPPGGAEGATILLARASTAEQERFIGNQAGGRVFLFLRTDDFERDYAAYRARGVSFIREPRQERYGTVAVFEDLYGNLWDLVGLGASGNTEQGMGEMSKRFHEEGGELYVPAADKARPALQERRLSAGLGKRL